MKADAPEREMQNDARPDAAAAACTESAASEVTEAMETDLMMP